jgi:hypothetical protein
MSLKRPLVRAEPPAPAPTLEFELVNVTRLQCVLDTKLALEFDLYPEKGHSYKKDKTWLTVTLGERVICIATPRLLYVETFPAQAKKLLHPAQQ